MKSKLLDISVALNTGTFTLFAGTGFSKYLTNNVAPSWIELLEECTSRIDSKSNLKNQLFLTDSDCDVTGGKFDLFTIAQMLEMEFRKKKKDLKNEICEIVKDKINATTIDPIKLEKVKAFFENHPNVNIVTTNYDTIFSDYIFPNAGRIFVEGSTIPKINSSKNIYHLHGCVSRPNSIIVTLGDYYRFLNRENYFSRKFYTLIQETTVAIIGYSLGDFNLNSIFNEVRYSKRESLRKSDVFYITKNKTEEIYTKFYYHTYGIQVIDDYGVERFINDITELNEEAKSLIESVDSLQDVLNEKANFEENYLKLRVSLSEILIQATSIGVDTLDINFHKFLVKILEQKRSYTRETGAWDQYVHLADWLIEVGSLISMENSEIESDYLNLVKYSFNHASKEYYFGYSWNAWWEWYNRWDELKIENQHLLNKLIEDHSWSSICAIEGINTKSNQ
ncbi:MAG: SIR2 family protein [Reichenbachiella sp.]